MPELADVSAHFDDIEVFDSYTGKFLFRGQLASFVEAAREGSTNLKRTMSVAPDIEIPFRRMFQYFGENWIVGNGNVDGLYNQRMRKTYWITKAMDMVERLTPAEACLEKAGTIFGASKVFLKDTINYTSDSEYDPQWEFSVAATEQVVKGSFLVTMGKIYRVREYRLNEGGFLLATADQLDDDAKVAVDLTAVGDFDPITETFVETLTPTFGILLEPTKLFRFKSEADRRFNAGDASLILPVIAAVGSLVTIATVKWKILSCTPELDAWNYHIRLA